jgi:hypothetical protein
MESKAKGEISKLRVWHFFRLIDGGGGGGNGD